jgi:hypothetical protein
MDVRNMTDWLPCRLAFGVVLPPNEEVLLSSFLLVGQDILDAVALRLVIMPISHSICNYYYNSLSKQAQSIFKGICPLHWSMQEFPSE